MDLIDRDALVLNVSGHVISMSVCLSKDERDGMERMFNTIMNDIQNAPAVNRWIPVEDALPDALQNVLVCTDINTVTIAWINGDGWTFADTGNGHTENWSFADVKYWMHLPEPPKCEQK